MTQQVEPLTKTATINLQKGLSTQKAVAVCDSLAENASCSLNGVNGQCESNTCSYVCPNTTIVLPVSWVCDGEVDCPDGSDENPANCPIFTCLDGKTLPSLVHCNGVPDCKDASDEANCLNIPIIVSVIVAPYVTDVTIVKSAVTFGWDVALAAFKSVLELAFAAMAFLFPAYFLAEPEIRRFILRKGETEPPKSEPQSPSQSAPVEMKPLQGEGDQGDGDRLVSE